MHFFEAETYGNTPLQIQVAAGEFYLAGGIFTFFGVAGIPGDPDVNGIRLRGPGNGEEHTQKSEKE
jgi:hypothetical protein